MIQNGNFDNVSISEARSICDSLRVGDVVVLDERMMNHNYQDDKFFFTQKSADGRHEFYTSGQYTKHFSRLAPNGRVKVLDVSVSDCSISVELSNNDKVWISYGCVDYLATKEANSKPLIPTKIISDEVDEVDDLAKDNEIKRLQADNNVLTSTIELMETENNMLKKENEELKKGVAPDNVNNISSLLITLINKCGGIRGTRWSRQGQTIVVVQEDDNYIIIDTSTFFKVRKEAMTEDEVIKELVFDGWILIEDSLKNN